MRNHRNAALWAMPGLLGATLGLPTAAIASDVGILSPSVSLEQISEYSNGNDGFVRASRSTAALDQVTSVTQLSDVQPTDWAFQALQSLVEKYGCIVGYPDGTFRGQRAMTRYEFAAGLNACLDRINELIAAATADLATKEDLATLQRLQEEFAAELATIRGRVENLEGRVAQLEATQFSTTTKLQGEALFWLGSAFGGDKAVPSGQPSSNVDIDDNLTFANRFRLVLTSSFTGRDQLRTRLQAGNIDNLSAATGTDMARPSYDLNNGNDLQLNQLWYTFPIGDKATVRLATSGLGVDDVLESLHAPLSSDSRGAVSRFGRYNPLTFRTDGGAGAGFKYKFSDRARLSLVYLTDEAGSPEDKKGLFNGNYYAGAQIVFGLGDSVDVGLTYANSYAPGSDVSLTNNTGSLYGNRPFGDVATQSNIYGVSAQARISPKFTLSGWWGLTDARAETSGPVARSGDNATLQTWAVSLAFPDLGKRGNLGGLIFGMPPKLTSNDVSGQRDEDTALHIEALYRMAINDNIAITPGFYVVTNPEHNSKNDTVWVGTLRTTFTF
ncbi:iron uptake porin [Trichothermofontia sp.]